ncbi:MAG TPA: NADH-quinone oxidoreductase subunit J [Methylophilaceae bacterium]|jgi:NADH-quinone oxidoreductase subunit J|nr:NADH-quinone oxidoreductase subunit J [Methylophilaceae bacterium]HAP04885.1 NADH-quinone oxidoreductase subunit J [Methylophilaceae bacterium]HBO18630.1 NADH-quinone oxidoreductase subunit J [Methylophilaceae bacterium]HCB67890.1 NADH-quinone oxidoreductase subunit J [Methylophilaceae bacterium]HCC72348.1 NADH-quinone oxidoreductase subunit J [Methylophilaceae bacterium]
MFEFKDFVFYVLSFVLIASGLSVITSRNPVTAALSLVLAFFNAAGIWLLLQAEFLAIALVLVYVGAVMVLFLFVVMMLDINFDKLREGFWDYLPMAGFIGILMTVEMVMVFKTKPFNLPPISDSISNTSNTEMIGNTLYSNYVLPFELASVILLIAIVSAIALTLRDRKDSKKANPAEQVAVKRQDRVRLVRMKSEEKYTKPKVKETR